MSPARDLASRLTSRRGAWVSLGLVVLVLVALFGALGRAELPASSHNAPTGSESERVSALLETFPGADRQSVMVVATRTDGRALADADLAVLGGLAERLADDAAEDRVSAPIVADDGAAALLVTPIEVGESNGETAEHISELRATLADRTADDLTLQVTGGPAFGADVAAAFDGADFTLLIVTILIVAVLLIVTYRSPILWLVPLVVVALADRVAGFSTAALGTALGLQFDAGIISVLVFGAGTNYALLLISRYREQLLRTPDHRRALADAWRGTAPAILASNLTVVLALLTLGLAVIPGTRGLGLSSALGLLIALAAVLLALPPVLALVGRRIFWPFVPKPEDGDADARHGRTWRAIAAGVVRRPARSLIAGLALLAVMTTGLIGTALGLDQLERFRVPSESAAGLATLGEHFPAGEAQPIWIVADAERAQAVTDAAARVDGVVRAHPVALTDDGALASIMVTGEPVPGTPESLELVEQLRTTVHAVEGADAVVGGAVATDLDAREATVRDLLLVAPLVLGVSFVVLLVLLRSLVAPVLLLLVNVASALAAIGAGAWLSRVLFGQHALDLPVPLLAFLFLVALGIDYTIFLVHRARAETREHGTRQGMVRAVAATGGVITSAGIVLAAVFAALGVLPLVTLGQLGLIVGLGVVVDTLVVRTVIVPALFGMLGDRIWWPSRPAQQKGAESSHEHRAPTALVG